MSTAEIKVKSLEMTTILLETYEMADMIKHSAEVAEYLYWKNQLDQDQEAKARVRVLKQKKELFEDCQRFGHFHPDYHAAKEQLEQAIAFLDELEVVQRFKQAEEALDDTLHSVSTIIARAVSDSIKVPSNNPLPTEGGCSSGGSCSGNCG